MLVSTFLKQHVNTCIFVTVYVPYRGKLTQLNEFGLATGSAAAAAAAAAATAAEAVGLAEGYSCIVPVYSAASACDKRRFTIETPSLF